MTTDRDKPRPVLTLIRADGSRRIYEPVLEYPAGSLAALLMAGDALSVRIKALMDAGQWLEVGRLLEREWIMEHCPPQNTRRE